MAKRKVIPMPRMLFASDVRAKACQDSWWAGCDRAEFAARLAARQARMERAALSDLVYGPHRGVGVGRVPAVRVP